jgi:hypothetical protein
MVGSSNYLLLNLPFFVAAAITSCGPPIKWAATSNTSPHNRVFRSFHLLSIESLEASIFSQSILYHIGAKYSTALIIAPAHISVRNDVFAWFIVHTFYCSWTFLDHCPYALDPPEPQRQRKQAVNVARWCNIWCHYGISFHPLHSQCVAPCCRGTEWCISETWCSGFRNRFTRANA